MSFFRLTAREIREKTANTAIDPVEIAEAFIENASSDRDRLNSFITLTSDLAVNLAERLKNQLSAGKTVGPLAGVPVAVKDNICLRDYPTTCGSKILSGHVSPYNATVVDRLIDAGAIIIGKTNMDEFAMGSTGETSYFGPCKNPVNREYSPGGSSSGSAACVAGLQCPLSLGTDTGGSIRQPATLCGIVGLKPTYGTVSRYGLVAYGSSLDQIGPLARNVNDAELLFSVICGRDKRDSTSVEYAFMPNSSEPNDITELRIGVPHRYIDEGAADDVVDAFEGGINILRSSGCTITNIELPDVRTIISAYYITAMAEASSNLARFDGARYGYRSGDSGTLDEMYENSRSVGFGEEVKRRIMLGTWVLSAGYYDQYYQRARDIRDHVRQVLNGIFEAVDMIALPTSPTAGIKLGEIQDPLSMFLADVYTVLTNFIGTCAISIPCGRCDNGLPIGFQLIGKPFEESLLFNTARHIERALDFDGSGGSDE